LAVFERRENHEMILGYFFFKNFELQLHSVCEDMQGWRQIKYA